MKEGGFLSRLTQWYQQPLQGEQRYRGAFQAGQDQRGPLLASFVLSSAWEFSLRNTPGPAVTTSNWQEVKTGAADSLEWAPLAGRLEEDLRALRGP